MGYFKRTLLVCNYSIHFKYRCLYIRDTKVSISNNKPGIIEAGKSLGISNKIIFYKIQIPIAIRQSLPAYGNEIILMMKGTSLASTVTLMDLTGVAKYIISTTFKPIEVFIVAGGIYLFMTFIIHNVIKYLEKKYSFQQ
jgi:octopine/nopaline transport system permease protein